MIEELNDLYDGKGPLTERIETDRRTRTISQEEIKTDYENGLKKDKN